MGLQGLLRPRLHRVGRVLREHCLYLRPRYAVGLGNIWRVPSNAYRSGGGAFLLPYVTMLAACGVPLLFMELAVGQYTRRGPIGALGQLCPLLQGAGLGTVIISFLLSSHCILLIVVTVSELT